jgi:hypothetical protein
MKYTRKRNFSKKTKAGKKRQQTRKGGFFSFFKKKPKTTQEELTDLQKNIENTSMKEIEKKMMNEINTLQKLRSQCILNCKKTSIEYKDDVLREQLNSMIENKSDYEWGNMCANSMKVVDCSNYLKSYKKIEMYKNYVDQMNKKIQQLFTNYQNSVSQKTNISTTTTATTMDSSKTLLNDSSSETASDTSSDNSSEEEEMKSPLQKV